jgi:hypothetical protein
MDLIELYKNRGLLSFLEKFEIEIKDILENSKYNSLNQLLNLISGKELTTNLHPNIDIDYLSTMVDDKDSKLHTVAILKILHDKKIISTYQLSEYMISLIDNYDANILFDLNSKSTEFMNSLYRYYDTDIEDEYISSAFFHYITTTIKIFDNSNYIDLFNKLVDLYSFNYLKFANKESDNYIDELSNLFTDLYNNLNNSDITILNLRKLIDDKSIINILTSKQLYINILNSDDSAHRFNIYSNKKIEDIDNNLHLELLRSNSSLYITNKIYANMCYNYFTNDSNLKSPIIIDEFKHNSLYEILLLAQYQILNSIIIVKESNSISFEFTEFKLDKHLIDSYINDIGVFTNPNLLLLDLYLFKYKIIDNKYDKYLIEESQSLYNNIDSKVKYRLISVLKDTLDGKKELHDLMYNSKSNEIDTIDIIRFYSKLIVNDFFKDIDINRESVNEFKLI